MNVFSIRKGFANNSSSTHSTIIYEDISIFEKYQNFIEQVNSYFYEYENFLLTDKKKIKRYFHIMLYRQIDKCYWNLIYSSLFDYFSYSYLEKSIENLDGVYM